MPAHEVNLRVCAFCRQCHEWRGLRPAVARTWVFYPGGPRVLFGASVRPNARPHAQFVGGGIRFHMLAAQRTARLFHCRCRCVTSASFGYFRSRPSLACVRGHTVCNMRCTSGQLTVFTVLQEDVEGRGARYPACRVFNNSHAVGVCR